MSTIYIRRDRRKEWRLTGGHPKPNDHHRHAITYRELFSISPHPLSSTHVSCSCGHEYGHCSRSPFDRAQKPFRLLIIQHFSPNPKSDRQYWQCHRMEICGRVFNASWEWGSGGGRHSKLCSVNNRYKSASNVLQEWMSVCLSVCLPPATHSLTCAPKSAFQGRIWWTCNTAHSSSVHILLRAHTPWLSRHYCIIRALVTTVGSDGNGIEQRMSWGSDMNCTS